VPGKWKPREDPPKRKATESRSDDPRQSTHRRECRACKNKDQKTKASCPACKGDGYIDIRMV